MDRLKYIISCLVVFLFLCPAAFGGEEESTTAFFRRGNDFFKQGDYQKALLYFTKARQQGMDSAALHYNTGVSHYKLKHYSQAAKAFDRAAAFPRLSALALYNRGLTAVRQRDVAGARKIFQDIFEQAEDEKLRDLAAVALLKLGERSASRPWVKTLSWGLGYDDNVGLIADDQVIVGKEGDGFAMTSVRIRGPLGRLSNRLPGLNFKGSVYYRKYFEQDDYDYGSLSLGVYYRDMLAGWLMETGGDYAYVVFDNEGLEQIPSLNVEARRKLFHFLDFSVGLRVSYLDVLDSDYEYLGGWRQNYSTEVSWKRSAVRAMAGLGFELNDRDDENYSPTRQSVMAAVTLTLIKDVDVYLGFNYRSSDFSLAGTTEDREEDRFRSVLRLSYLVHGNWLVSGEYRYTDNDSNNKAYEYTRNVVALKVTMNF